MSTEQSYFTPEEIDRFMEQRRRANADARAELERRGHAGPHSRVTAHMAEGRWPVAEPAPAPSEGAPESR